MMLSMTSVFEYQFWVYKTRMIKKFEVEESRGDKNGEIQIFQTI